MKYGVVIVAAGKGSRMHLGFNKVFADLKDGCSILEHSVQIFLYDLVEPVVGLKYLLENRVDPGDDQVEADGQNRHDGYKDKSKL